MILLCTNMPLIRPRFIVVQKLINTYPRLRVNRSKTADFHLHTCRWQFTSALLPELHQVPDLIESTADNLTIFFKVYTNPGLAQS